MKSIYNCIGIGEGVFKYNATGTTKRCMQKNTFFSLLCKCLQKQQKLNYEEQRDIVQQLKNNRHTCI